MLELNSSYQTMGYRAYGMRISSVFWDGGSDSGCVLPRPSNPEHKDIGAVQAYLDVLVLENQ